MDNGLTSFNYDSSLPREYKSNDLPALLPVSVLTLCNFCVIDFNATAGRK